MSKHGKKDKKHDKHEKHEKKRKHKKDDKKEKSSKKHKSSVSSEDVERAMDLKSALQHVESMIKEFPDLADDLRGIFQMVDAGEVVVIGGIENQEMKNRLASMFPLMGLVESGPNQSFSKHKVAKHISLIEKFGSALSPPPAQSARAPTPKPRAQPIGPQMPPRAPPVEQDEDDVAVGPALPGMKGYREASADVEERMRRQAEAEEALQWKKLRGEADDTSKPAVVQREEWMLSLPNDESIQAALGGAPRKFRARDKDERDDTWFAAPADRERAMREKAQMEMLGYVPGKVQAPSERPPAVAVEETGPTVQKRQGKSLLEAHQEARKKDSDAGPVPWDRERDMSSRRQMTGDAAAKLIQQANEMSSRFAAPKVSRQFL